MDIAFILSADEIITLLSQFPDHTEAGERFISNALPNALFCDLSSLAEKNLAALTDGKLELAPALRMAIDAIARAESADNNDGVWDIRSLWVFLRCEEYSYNEGYWKITPVNNEEE